MLVATLLVEAPAVLAADASKENPGATTMAGKMEERGVRGHKLKDDAGREWWRVEIARASYAIPDEYISTVDRAGVLIQLQWPSARPVRTLPAGSRVDAADLVTVFIAAPAAGTVARDSYDAHKEALSRYESRPSAGYPGLVEYFSFSKSAGPVVHYYASAPEEKARTPSGNPYLCSVLDPGETESVRCDSLIAVPDGNSLRIRFARKHLAEWKRVYAETLGLIESFRK